MLGSKKCFIVFPPFVETEPGTLSVLGKCSNEELYPLSGGGNRFIEGPACGSKLDLRALLPCLTICVCVCFRGRVSHCSPVWSQAYCDPPASALQVLVL